MQLRGYALALKKLEEKRQHEKEVEERKKQRALERKEMQRKKRNTEKKRIANRKYYITHGGKALQDEREKRIAEGDTLGLYAVVLAKNGKCSTVCNQSKWRNDALKAYDELVRKSDSVVFPKRVFTDFNGKAKDRQKRHEYELLFIEYSRYTTNGTKIKNTEGKFVRNMFIDDDHFRIIDKHIWNIEENFHVYGYDPVHDRKTYQWIWDNLLMKCLSRESAKRIYVYSNKLIIQYDDMDFDFIMCKTSDEADRLYNALMRQSEKEKCKYHIFLDHLEKNTSACSKVLEMMTEKTGWQFMKCATPYL